VPISPQASSSAPLRRAISVTLPPSPAIFAAVALPMPDDAPVMTTCRPVKSISTLQRYERRPDGSIIAALRRPLPLHQGARLSFVHAANIAIVAVEEGGDPPVGD